MWHDHLIINTLYLPMLRAVLFLGEMQMAAPLPVKCLKVRLPRAEPEEVQRRFLVLDVPRVSKDSVIFTSIWLCVSLSPVSWLCTCAYNINHLAILSISPQLVLASIMSPTTIICRTRSPTIFFVMFGTYLLNQKQHTMKLEEEEISFNWLRALVHCTIVTYMSTNIFPDIAINVLEVHVFISQHSKKLKPSNCSCDKF